MPLDCPTNDGFQTPAGAPNEEMADLLDHLAELHCPVPPASSLIKTAAGKMRNPTGTPDPNRGEDLSQYAKNGT